MTLKETVDELAAALKKRARELRSFGLDAPEMPSIDLETLVGQYENMLRARCSEPGCSVAPIPNLDEALTWAIVRRPPFDANGAWAS